MTNAEDYLQFGQMLLNGGQLNGKRLLSPKTVEMMSAVQCGRHVARTAKRPRLRIERASGERRDHRGLSRVRWQLWLGRRFRDTFLGGPEGENRWHSHGANQQSQSGT